MRRHAIFTFGVLSHAMFLGVFLYMALFVGNILVPKTIDAPAARERVALRLAIDMALLLLFAVPHSVMARPAFKRWWTQFVPQHMERSMYVLIANLCVILMMWQWRPIEAVVWHVPGPVGRALMWTLFAAGWLLVPLASLMINHFDLFGTRQVWLHLRQEAYTHLPFRTPWLYSLVRHPLYVGWMIAFWVTPTMTVGHLMFACVLTAYMLIAIPIEERDLVAAYGEQYEEYRRRVPALIPRVNVKRGSQGKLSEAAAG